VSEISVFSEKKWSKTPVWAHAATGKTTAAPTDNRNVASHSNFGSKSEDACWQQQQQQQWWQYRRGRHIIAEDVSNSNYAINSKVISREPASAMSPVTEETPAGLGTPATALQQGIMQHSNSRCSSSGSNSNVSRNRWYTSIGLRLSSLLTAILLNRWIFSGAVTIYWNICKIPDLSLPPCIAKG
jgi:hypothetical protein